MSRRASRLQDRALSRPIAKEGWSATVGWEVLTGFETPGRELVGAVIDRIRNGVLGCETRLPHSSKKTHRTAKPVAGEGVDSSDFAISSQNERIESVDPTASPSIPANTTWVRRGNSEGATNTTMSRPLRWLQEAHASTMLTPHLRPLLTGTWCAASNGPATAVPAGALLKIMRPEVQPKRMVERPVGSEG